MKAIITAGGSGTRLHPLTLAINKHLLSLYDKPIIYHSIEKLVEAGIHKIMIVTSPHHVGDFVKILGSGHNFISPVTGKQIQIVYGIQNEPNGIAYVIHIARDYIAKDDFVLYLGDNIIEDNIGEHIKNRKDGATIFLKKVKDPERFGVAQVDKNNKVLSIEEKPKKPKSDLAVTGIYLFDNSALEKTLQIKPSKRGEYEITDVINLYIKEKKLNAVRLTKKWFDTGTFDSMLDAANFMKRKYAKKPIKK